MTSEEEAKIREVTSALLPFKVGDRVRLRGRHNVTIVSISQTSAWPPCYMYSYDETPFNGSTTNPADFERIL